MMGIELDALPGLDVPVGVHGCLGGVDPGAVTSPDIYLMMVIYINGSSDGSDVNGLA